ncbi:aspartate-semialdehyde dehydrogenase [Listeria newyorkensis]|uniref:Aspartate-semialdehyde dehydrogenase n=1 Tax=Listeria newyorkensis TaxID=1497681 RepID=A0ABX4XLH5_9LIST|nr:aspartate-semialdehyde dehydrogenase [Listeria newyorkensis]PNP90615.1 aspartate-semialdehyde dehydrogenase [Listeria newyorkensis]
MIHLLIFDKALNQKGVVSFKEGTFLVHLWDWQTFQLTVTTDIIDTGDFITILEDKNPVYSGVVKEAVAVGKRVTVDGYDLRYLLEGMQMNQLYGRNLVSATPIAGNSITIIQNTIAKAFPLATVVLDAEPNRTTFSFSPRLKNAYEFLRANNIANDLMYQIFIVSKKRLLVKIKYLQDRSDHVVLLNNITHQQLQKRKSSKNKYNQILGLGQGEDESRDFYFYNQQAMGDYPQCYIYDLRENITHDELIQRTLVKFKELQFEYEIQFKTQKNKVAQFLQDYEVGDYVTFSAASGERIKDLITSYTITYKAGQRSDAYELTTGIDKNALTQKIKELKEGGYA